MTTAEDVRTRLEGNGYVVADERELGGNQIQIAVEGIDGTVNIWESTGTCNVQGREAELLKEALGELVGKGKRRGQPLPTNPAVRAPMLRPASTPKVFVVYGHDLV